MNSSNMEYVEASEKAVRFLNNSFKTEYEVRNKLKSLNCEEKIIEKVISHLIDIHYIDDEKYVNAYIRQSRKIPKYSIYEIENKLRMKGISNELIDMCKNELDDGIYEKQIIDTYLEKHRRDDINKAKAYLFRRGFRNLSF